MSYYFNVLLALLLLLPSVTFAEEPISAIQELGRHLFFDTRLSVKENRSCALCHSPTHGWSNTFTKTIDINGNHSTLNTPSLLNVSLFTHFSQADPTRKIIDTAITNPMFSTHPIEMGITPKKLISRIAQDSCYPSMFERSFGDKNISVERIVRALKQYLTLITSQESRYLRYRDGDITALTKQEQHGLQLFYSDKLNCSACHGGPLLNQPVNTLSHYQNTGLYGVPNKNGMLSYPIGEPGVRQYTKRWEDDGKFRIPSLINVSNTGPWGHDGSFQSLESVIESYARGGRKLSYGPNKGDGYHHPAKSTLINGFNITTNEKKALIAFLRSLSIDQDWTRYPFNSPFGSSVSTKNEQNSTPSCLHQQQSETILR
ncbi:cytochrome-c peroxidase [Vibrio sp. Isolate25]|uniref:cytochrome-c peroxidase n=1 Tax=Vibrio sp. Isolate25 TaxID=2908535 RepID=UPI001EFDF3E0|nr:cytochrome c peroxidase [Vibrio sp. Isolate25]MCG9595692.1 cytochrome-c peroxidase [Vibrio sp. Isolate25]